MTDRELKLEATEAAMRLSESSQNSLKYKEHIFEAAMQLLDSSQDPPKYKGHFPLSRRIEIEKYTRLNGFTFDLIVMIQPSFTLPYDKNFTHFPAVNDSYHGIYLFDITKLPVMVRSPELLDIIERKFFDNIGGVVSLKSKYAGDNGCIKKNVMLTSHSSNKGVEITQEIVDIIMRRQVCKIKYRNDIGFELPIKHELLGYDNLETHLQRIKNMIYTGRCDHIISDKNHPKTPQDNIALEIIRQYCKKFKTARIHTEFDEWKTYIAG